MLCFIMQNMSLAYNSDFYFYDSDPELGEKDTNCRDV